MIPRCQLSERMSTAPGISGSFEQRLNCQSKVWLVDSTSQSTRCLLVAYNTTWDPQVTGFCILIDNIASNIQVVYCVVIDSIDLNKTKPFAPGVISRVRLPPSHRPMILRTISWSSLRINESRKPIQRALRAHSQCRKKRMNQSALQGFQTHETPTGWMPYLWKETYLRCAVLDKFWGWLRQGHVCMRGDWHHLTCDQSRTRRNAGHPAGFLLE